jgi:dipeptidyl aminopeptidase/acylaminoacyl peptidase
MESTPLISRSALFGNPDRASAQISPDGSKLAFLADVDGVLNVWVGPVDNPAAARPVTKDKKRGIRGYAWAYNNRHIGYIQDKDGDENWHIYITDLKTNETQDLTPIDGVQARLQEFSHKFPDEVLVGINDRNPELHDIYRLNIKTGERKLIQRNDGYVGFTTDDDFNIRLATKITPDGGSEIFKVTGGDKAWTSFMKISPEDVMTTGPAGFDKSGRILYMTDSVDRNTAALVAYDLDADVKKVLASDARADVGMVMAHPTEKTIEAVSFTYERRKWKILDNSIKADLDYLKTVADGEVYVTSRTLDDQHWIVVYVMDNGPVRYYHYDRAAHKAEFLFTNRKELEGQPLAKMHPVVIKSRDGLNLVSYLSLPVWTDRDGNGRPEKPLPMVLSVHGGPWYRDSWGYNPMDQWLTNRGYAVLSVNFRGSTGFGKSFVNAANLEWGRKMHDDLIDAVNWAIKQKIAQPKGIAIMGGSYGGYATLAGLTFTPDVFACGVDIVGPSNLITLMKSIPPYWKPMLDLWTARVGDYRTEEGKRMLNERSPLTYVDRIVKPLLIGQGANDPRVKQAESDQIVKAMEDSSIPVAYVLFSDEGHGFARPENRQAFYAVAEAFLAKHLGGRYEPIGKDFEGSSITVPKGADQVPGLADALPKGG